MKRTGGRRACKYKSKKWTQFRNLYPNAYIAHILTSCEVYTKQEVREKEKELNQMIKAFDWCLNTYA